MKTHLLLAVLIVVGTLAGSGCAKKEAYQLPPNDVISAVPPATRLQVRRWVNLLGKNIDRVPEYTSLDVQFPFDLKLPQGFAAIGSSRNSLVAVSPDDVYFKICTKLNLEGGDLNFWRKTVYRVLTEVNGLKVVSEEGFTSYEDIDGWKMRATKLIGSKEYTYNLVWQVHDGEIFMVEMYGPSEAVKINQEVFDKSIKSADYSYWRKNFRYREPTYRWQQSHKFRQPHR
jgi:hypothetical protein